MAKTLIAFFSRADENYFSGAMRYVKVGNTEIVVNLMKDMIDADSFKIEMKDPYSPVYMTCIEEAKKDLRNQARPELANYLDSIEDAAEFFAAAYNALKPKGMLLFDISSKFKLEKVLDCNTFAEDDGERAYIWKNCYDPESRLISMELSFYERQGDMYRRFEEKHIQRAHGEDELISAMEKAGFDAKAYSFLTMENTKEEDLRIQFIGRKRA